MLTLFENVCTDAIQGVVSFAEAHVPCSVRNYNDATRLPEL